MKYSAVFNPKVDSFCFQCTEVGCENRAAIDGRLQVKAIFPEGEVEIEQFESIPAPEAEPEARISD
jgi:hypothetical protein